MNNLDASVRNWLADLIGVECTIERHVFSGQDEVYRLTTPAKTYYLKIADSLESERDNLHKLKPVLDVPDVAGFHTISAMDYLLLSEVPGKNLAELVGEWPSEDIVHTFAVAIRKLHALDVNAIFPGSAELGAVVLHGDMSLPNIIVSERGQLGYIDFGKLSVGSPDQDLADAVWSLQRNLGPGYGEMFLQEYGPTPMTSKLKAALSFIFTPEP